MKLEGKRALVTGAGSGVGRGIALGFAREGARVALAGRREAALVETAGLIERACGGAALVFVADLADEASAAGLASRAAAGLGGLDVLVNNAAIYLPGSLAETTTEDWSRTLAINLSGPFFLTRAALPWLEASRGVVLNVSSNLGGRPVPGAAAYCVSKAGLDMLTQIIALEQGGSGVRAASIRLGIVDTPIHAARAGDDPGGFLRAAGALHPVGRIGQPADAAAAAIFLASDEASWVTGALFAVDGGIGLR